MEILKAKIISEDAGTHTLTVQVMGSASVWLDAIPAANDIDFANCAPGDSCAVLFFDGANHRDAAVIAVYT